MSAFLPARAPELRPEIVNDLNIHPAFRRKLPLRERSQSDLNTSNNATVRLVKDDHDSSSIYTKSPLSGKKGVKSAKSREAIFVDGARNDARPLSYAGYSVAANRPAPLNKKAHRFSASTTTSAADTLVADSLISPTDSHFTRDNKAHTVLSLPEQLEPLREISSDKLGSPMSEELDSPELPSMPARPWHRHVPHSSSCYSSTPWDEGRPPTPPRGTGHGEDESPLEEANEEQTLAKTIKPSQESAESGTTAVDQDRGTPHLIRYVTSTDNIRPQYVSVRPAARQQTSMSSLWSTDSEGAESLDIPRRRAHGRSPSLSSHPSMPFDSMPAGQSDAVSPIAGRRRAFTSSSYTESIMPSALLNRAIKPSSSYASIEERIRINDSAVPEPLFTSSVPLPHLPLEPSSNHFTTEMDDTICEMQGPTLREKRSGYNMKRRSAGDVRLGTSRSNVSGAESDRWSTGSFIFPQWAQFFYTGRKGLISANQSRVTLAGPPYSATAGHSQITLAGPQYSAYNRSTRTLHMQRSFDQHPFDLPRPLRHQYSRAETIASYNSRAESSHSNWETVYSEDSPSQSASRFFRPHGRQRSQTDIRFVTPDGSIRPSTRRRMSDPSVRHGYPDSEADYYMDHGYEVEGGPGPSKLSHHMTNRDSTHAAATPTPKQKSPWTRSYQSLPRLVQNSRLVRNLSAWRVPSIDEPFPADILGPVNRQIVCFCLGFILPPLWLLAAFLPLPQCGSNSRATEKRPATEVAADVEQQASWAEERRMLKGKWWRNINRVMSLIGVAIMAVIIALAVLAAR